MDLKEHYNGMWENALGYFRKQNFELDNSLISGVDNRFGLTLVVRPSEEVKNKIQSFQKQIAQIEPSQYFYLIPDMHITVLTIISGNAGFKLEYIDQEKYINLIKTVLVDIEKFGIAFKGITASPSSVMIQGFPLDNNLNQIRETVRSGFRNSNLQHTIDKRYLLQTAHSTVIRFKQQPTQPELFLQKLQEFRNYDFGLMEVCELELVYNNWYHSQALVKMLQKFKLE